MHRDPGFKRFFNTIAIFFAGYNLIVYAGNFETLFLGWEILGISSFLLIAFYRDRYLPVKNGFKVLSFYRLGDIALILAMWMSHHFWHKNITFLELNNSGWVLEHIQAHYLEALFISLMIVLAASIKSAQVPFSTWLPRAMEGPTASSAIFYGSLAVHIGAFVLLRTHAFWGHLGFAQMLVLMIGAITVFIATSISSVQSTVKTQIAYASIAQIGLIFIEIALGWHALALLHFAGNAFLRTYQLLVSPSVLSYLVHDMFFNFKPKSTEKAAGVWLKAKHGLYVLSLKEWNFDYLLHRYLWQPFKWLGWQMEFSNSKSARNAALIILPISFASWAMKPMLDESHYPMVAIVFSAMALLSVLKAFSARASAKHAWQFAVFSQLFIALAIMWNKQIDWQHTVLYLSGTIVCAVVGYFCLMRIKAMEQAADLNQYLGHSYEHPGLAAIFLLSCLGLGGFPITPTFVGVDLMFTHISAQQILMAMLIALNLLFLELALIRIYCRVFLGQHKKEYHPISFKSS
jgi:NADH:ubiquinone oxidoreductase subunit 5 (subunit L)/multisubunit Na+/H+ antiporter MnhA subunit